MVFARFCFVPFVLIVLPIRGQIVVREESSMFGLVTRLFFNNGLCPSQMGRNGTCYTAEECSERNGIAEGQCADGLGVCCIFEITTCGGNVVENCTLVSGTRLNGQTCMFTLTQCSSDICFFRLDFDSLTLGSTLPSNGDCSSDTISFSAPTVPILCGSLSGQHIYLPASPGSVDSFSLNFGLSAVLALATAYQIQVRQIPCGRSFTPPLGCNQFFFGELSGQIQTYNYMMGAGYHLNNQNYDICVRKELGICQIGYLAFPGIQGFAFGPSFGFSMLSLNGDMDCVKDYILVPNSANLATPVCQTNGAFPATVTKYCGYYLNCMELEFTNEIIGTTDFRITVVTDGSDAFFMMGEMTGFQLQYQLIPCSSVGKTIVILP
ncbi:hypothetical protein TCAL_07618 [Tigriopus californicus]|uniref:CUB domain-containing protein n=1 Tax=Tigriopus californicus TaxID=6832 RepID=A0A553NVS1_TIGCA|nr:uncharacterized protein LOC131878589 [Tigriopus californicus]TRY69535.1 hypothetical protein TCAL_07618 [Tigriopus californicus]